MPIGAARPSNSLGENLIHVGAVRMRVVGSGDLILSLHSLDDIKSTTNPNPVVMTTSTNIEPSKLFNMIDQRIRLKLITTEEDEWFRINRIILYAKPVFTDRPR
jgi:hypothetical protein